MALEAGVYLLRNFQSGSALGVEDADWDDGRVDCWPAKEANSDPDDLVYQRFLVHPNPAQQGTYNILSLRAGGYLVHNVDDKSASVRCRSTCAESRECLWIPEKAKPHGKGAVYTFHPFKSTDHCLAVDDAKDEKSKAVLAPAKEVAKEAHDQWWKLERTDLDEHKLADWMGQVTPQNTKFSMLSIPGTHQTFALNKAGAVAFHSDNPHCQNHSPYLQLCNGMRYFDLRLDFYAREDKRNNIRPGLIARHGIHAVFVWEGYSFSALIQSVVYFLEKHPSETVFMCARMEGAGSCEPKKWAEIFYDELEPWKSYFYHVPAKRGFSDLSLEECRGKAIIYSGKFKGGVEMDEKLGNFPPPLNNLAQFWRTHGHTEVIALEGPPEQLSISEFPGHHKVMTKFLETASADRNPNHIYWLGMNSSGKPTVAGQVVGELYNPLDFFNILKKDWIPLHINEKKHPKGVRLGLITLDFYEQAMDFVKFIIERNEGVSV